MQGFYVYSPIYIKLFLGQKLFEKEVVLVLTFKWNNNEKTINYFSFNCSYWVSCK